MNKLISMALVFITATALTAGCSSVPTQNQPTAVDTTANQCTKGFQERKAKILNRINERQTKMQQIENCVQASSNCQELKACMPKGNYHHHHHHHSHQ